MADKRTTPQMPEGAPQTAPQAPRRKKRAAPTIDLTATEMSPPETASPPQSDLPPGPAPAAPAATAEPRPGGPFGMATLAAGVAGAAAMMLVLFALWLTGLLPARTVVATDTGGQAAADTKAIDALTQRVSKIEEAIKKLAGERSGHCRAAHRCR